MADYQLGDKEHADDEVEGVARDRAPADATAGQGMPGAADSPLRPHGSDQPSPAKSNTLTLVKPRYSLVGFKPPEAGPTFVERRRRNTEKMAGERKRRRANRRRRRIVGWLMLLVGLSILLCGWVAFRAYQAYSNLQVAADLVSKLQNELVSDAGPDTNALLTLENLQDATDSAKSAVNDPFYRMASGLPKLGPNLDAVSEIAETVDDLAVNVLPPLVRSATALNPKELFDGGSVSLEPIIEVAPALQSADAAVSTAILRMSSIDRAPLLGQVNSAVIELWSKLTSAKSLTDAGARVSRLMPAMMGADGPRTYLLVFQNLAEVRATGGLFGSAALLKVENGKISVGPTDRLSGELGYFENGVGGVDPALINLYGEAMEQYPGSANFSPDFPTGAKILKDMYEKRTGEAVDGVIATDPVALSYLMAGGQPVDVGDGVVLKSSNVVKFLMSDVYAKFDDGKGQTAREAFTAKATALVASQMLSGDVDPAHLVQGMRRAMNERRLLIWSTDEVEESTLAETSLAGSLPGTGPNTTLGVYLNDGSGSKLSYYLKAGATVKPGQCQPATGLRDIELTVTLHSNAPSSGLSRYVAGGTFGPGPYIMRTNVVVMAPAAGAITSVTQDGRKSALGTGSDHGRTMGIVAVDLKPGASSTLVYTLRQGQTTGERTMSAPKMYLTPIINPWDVTVLDVPPC